MFAYTNSIGQKISDIDQDLMYVVNATQPNHGSVSFDNYYIYYTPNYNYLAGDYFEYCVSDFNDTACSFVNVTVMNDAPVAVTDQYQIPKNTPAAFNVMYNDYDPNNDTIVISEVTPAAYGGVSLSDGNTRVRYTPIMSSEIYSDSFSYGITDGVLFGYAYVTVDVGNVPPKAGDLTITLKKNTNETYVDLPASDINALDVLTITIPKPSTIGKFRLTNTPGVGKVDIDGDEYSKVINNYRLWYTPLYGINGVYSEVISYNVFDGTDTTVGTIKFDVINDAPVAVDDEITSNKNLVTVYNVVANDFDLNQDDVQLNNIGATVTTTQGGYYKVIDTKNIEYHPAQGFLGNDSATYTITDIQAKPEDQLVATGNLRFIVVNQPPTPQDDVYTISKGHTVLLNVIANDTDPNNDIVSLAQTGTPNSGAFVTKGSETGITYVALNQTYSESWYYTAKDVDEATTQALVTVHVVNDLPVPVDDNVFVKWNSTALIDVLANDIDNNPGDKEILTISAISGATTAKGATITIVSNKLVRYVPVRGYTGVDSFTYSIFDQMDYSASAATVNIVVGNNAPSANPTTVAVHWSSSLPVNILDIAGNGDPDNDPIIVRSVTQPGNGVVTLVNGVATYKSNAYFTGVDSFGYTLFDWDLTNSSTVTVNVQNTAPVSAPITLTVPWNANPTTAYVVGACSDADNDPLKIKTLTPTAPFKGTLIVSDSNTNVRFTPSKDFSGVLTASYVVTDGPDTSTNTITITVTNNNKPTASPITRTVHWSTQTLGTTISILSAGQRDADGDTLTVSAVSNPTHGTATFTNTSITYKQTAGYTGSDEFTYTISDGLDTATATVTFTIYNTNPVAVDQVYSVFWGTHTTGTTLSVLANSSDADVQDTVTLKSVGATTPHGSATKQGNQVVFKPTIGNLNTVTFTYTATDGLADTTKQVTVTITDTKPVAVNDAVSVHWNTTSFDFNVKGNDYDADNDAISLQAITSQPIAGIVAIKSATAGTVTFTLPTGSFALGTYIAKYTITDGALTSDPANINIDITNANRPNALPISTRVHWRTPNSGLTVPITGLTSFDGDGDELHLTTSGNTFATSVAGSPSYVRYTRASWKGTDSVTYQVSDGKSSSSNVISIESYNTVPTASNIVNLYVPYTAFVNGLTINAMSLGNVNDADDDDKTFLYISAVTQPGTAGNVVTLNSATKTINYKPALAWTGQDSFTYTVSDGLDTVTRTISVYATYVAAGDAERAYDVHWKNYQAGKNFNVLDGYGNTGNSKIIQIDSTTGGNTYSILPTPNTVNNQLFFQNKRAYLDTDIIKLKANDGASTGTISVYMTVYDNAPTASNKAASGKWNQAVQTSVMTGASDPDTEDTATLGSFTSGAKGVVTKIDANTLSYLGNGGYVGTDSYTYTVTDGLLNTTRVVTVTLTNSPPVPIAQAYSVHWRTFQTGTSRVVTTGAYDADGNTISLVSVTQPDDVAAGTTTAVTASNTVNIKGTSTPYYGKSFKFTYTVTDGAQNGQASAQVTVSVTNQAPVAVADSDSIHWRTKNFVKNVLANDYDNDVEDKPFLRITGASANLGGSVTFNNTHITYTPKALFMGTEVISYIISDGAQTASTSYTIDVTDSAPVARPIAVSMHSSKYATGVVVAVTNNPIAAQKSTDADTADASFLRVSAVVQPTAPGSATFNDNSVTFKSGSATQLGVSTVPFTISDGLLTAQSTITVTVYNNAPTNTDYSGNCPWRTCLTDGVSIPVTANANDIDPEDSGKLVFTLATNPAYGTVTSPSNGVFLYKLKSGQGNVNSDSFKFTTSDGVLTVQDTISISIGNIAPVARDDTYYRHWLSVQPLVLRVSDNDTDADSDPFTIQTISTSTSTNGATLSIITPAKLFINYNLPTSSITVNKLGVTDRFSYRLSDTIDSSNAATVSVTIYNNAPSAGSITDSTKWNVPKTFVLGSLCSDPDGSLDNVVFGSLTSTPAAGSAVVTVQSSGTVRYTPATGAQAGSYSTAYSFTYTCTDGLLTGTGTVTITVSNNAPTLTGKSVSVQHNYNNPVITISGLLTSGSDGDSDTLSVKSLQTQTADASVTISGNSATSDTANIRTAANFVGTKTLTWSVTDGQLTSNTANYVITLLNTAPTCAAFSRTTDKNTAAAVANVATGSADINNDPLTFSLGDVSVGTASLNGNTLTYTPAARRSGTHTVQYITRDVIGAETTCVVSITVANRAPIAPSHPYTLEGSHADNHKYILDYMSDAAVSDPDIGDTVSLISATGGSATSCADASVGSVALVGGKIQWTRKSYSWVGSCNINVAVRDNDMNNPLTTNAVVVITVNPPLPPVANDDEYTTEQKNAWLQLPITGTAISNGVQYSGILENDRAPLGTGIVFDGLICTTSGYCRRTPTVANNLINYNVDTTNCVQDKFQYRIKTTDIMAMTAVGTVTIKFTNCFCSAALDIFFVIDSSSSVGSANFRTQKNFLVNLTNSLDISSSKVRVGVAQFGYDSRIERSLSGSKSDVVSTLTNLPYLSQYTNTLAGIYAALTDITGTCQNNGTYRYAPKGRANVPKVLVIITDGVSNAPCSCARSDGGRFANRYDFIFY
jgi:hypothetical protein